jgi:hypothetical protein
MWWTPVLTVIVLLNAVSARTSSGDLEFRIHPEDIVGGIPQAFTFVFVNHSHHDVRIPGPAIQGEDSLGGHIELQLRFTPLKPGPPGEGRGCAGDTFNPPSLMDRIKTWNVVHAGETLTFRADRQHLFYDDAQPGTYDFWASYYPPSVSRSDQNKLHDTGIDFANERLATGHVAFVKLP